MLLNVHIRNGNYAEVRQAVGQSKPDLLLLMEVNDQWLAELGSLEGHYSHSGKCPRDDNFGIALFSKFPFEKSRALLSQKPDGEPARRDGTTG
jgi:endonuclease/exonuclease/phosphatase (EEP) superfamily protein YafD